MMNLFIRHRVLRMFAVVFLLLSYNANGQENENTGLNIEQRPWTYKELVFTTPAYRKEALHLLIEEANRVANELSLAEKMPIVESNIIAIYITPPRLAQAAKTIGTITTSNYVYCVSVNNKFSSLIQTRLKEERGKMQTQQLWPMSKMDTNAAYQAATQFLAGASMDVEAINRDCNIRIDALLPEGKNGKHFVPVYWVYWMAKGGQAFGPVAEVELFMPTKSIRQLRVNKSEYILRKPLEVANLDYLLSQTNAPAETNLPGKR